jgi:hypothetical protein
MLEARRGRGGMRTRSAFRRRRSKPPAVGWFCIMGCDRPRQVRSTG